MKTGRKWAIRPLRWRGTGAEWAARVRSGQLYSLHPLT
jgi:hypothetical protein